MKKNRKAKAFPIVAIGASAGGLRAFEDLLNALPREPGMAFILVPHLAPQFKSHLAEILSRSTKLPVGTVRGGDRIAINRIYVVPSNATMRVKDGVLHLSSSGNGLDRRNPIDSFFRSLADDQRERVVGVLLSGAGTDGTAGLQAIKERGGRTFAQDGNTAARVSMPHSAVVSGCVDFVLPPAEIGRRLIVGRAGKYKMPAVSKAEGPLNRILELLRATRGVEFGLYKRNTLNRRIQRRMALRRLSDPEKYLRLLRSDSDEVAELFNDILICVTSYFREPESFHALKSKIYPRLLKNRIANTPIRIWVPGCSTGEEAYSHAINLTEYLGHRTPAIPFQIFATDVNPIVIDKARAGRYTKKALAGVSSERLRRFFVETEDGYRVAPFLREHCVFAVQNVVQDPPFTSLDLVSCRNLMIYLGPALQEKALQVFQYALKPKGILMLGRAETVGDFSGRFTPIDERDKVFSVRAPVTLPRMNFVQPNRFVEAVPVFKDSDLDAIDLGKQSPEDLQERLGGILPARFIPNGVIVNADLEILRFLGDTTGFLRPAPGKPSLNLRRMAPGALLLELRASIHAAKDAGVGVRKEIDIPDAKGVAHRTYVEVLPLGAVELFKHCYLVLFETAPAATPADTKSGNQGRKEDSRRIVELKANLAVSGEHLKGIIDEQESTNARLKSSNESLLSSNEELQSINEEFETTKEELQTTNEEFQATNEELTTSTDEVVRGNQILTRTNNDLSNLLANINIPVVLLDLDMKVHRFTPAAERVLGLSSDKVGRLITDLALPLIVPNLRSVLLGVVRSGNAHKQEVQDAQGRWYYLLVRPYRTDKRKNEKSRTEGAVITLIDITDRKVSEKAVLRLATVVLDSNDAIIVSDLKDRIIAWNKGAVKMYGYSEKEALGMSVRLLSPGGNRLRALDLVRAELAPLETKRRARDGRILDALITVTVLRDERGDPIEVATTERDITAQKKSERDREQSAKTLLRLAAVVRDSNDAVTVCDLDDRITAWNSGAVKMYGYTEKQALGMSIRRLMPKNKLIRAKDLVQKSAAPIEIQRRTRAGEILDVLITVTVLRDEKGDPVEVATTERDITAQKRADQEFRRLHAAVISAQETERKRLARELHDGVGQILSGVKFRLQALPGNIGLSGDGEAKIAKVGGFLDHAISEIRRVSQNLMPAELVDLGLGPALLTLCREFKERSTVRVTVRDEGAPQGISPDLALAFFRIAQEALNNIGKHSKATMAGVNLSVKGSELLLSVSDNGVGFKSVGDPRPRRRGFGLGNMRQRADSVGGSIEVVSAAGTGTTLHIRAPLSFQRGHEA